MSYKDERASELLNAPQAAVELDVHRSTVLRYWKEERLCAFQVIGSNPVFRRCDVEALAEELKRERKDAQSGMARRGWLPGRTRKPDTLAASMTRRAA